MIPNLKVLAIQFDIVWEDKLANFEKIETEFLQTLQPDETDLIVLPEMFATGFTMNPAKFFETESEVTFVWLKKWAKKLNSHFCAGLITQNESGQYLNSMVFIDPNGEISYYHKRHLFRMGEENAHYCQGEMLKVVNLKGWKINLQICYDLRFPVFARNQIVGGKPAYDLMIYIANWPEVRTYAWTNLLVSRAIENQAYVLGVNRTGLDGNGVAHIGASAIVDPIGKYTASPIEHKGKIQEILSYELLERSRLVFPVLLDADNFKLTIQ